MQIPFLSQHVTPDYGFNTFIIYAKNNNLCKEQSTALIFLSEKAWGEIKTKNGGTVVNFYVGPLGLAFLSRKSRVEIRTKKKCNSGMSCNNALAFDIKKQCREIISSITAEGKNWLLCNGEVSTRLQGKLPR